jgi:hypothetical protein
MMKPPSSHSIPGASLAVALKTLVADARRVIGEAPRDRQDGRDVAVRSHRRNDQAAGHSSGEVQRWLERFRQQVRSCWQRLREDGRALSGSSDGCNHRRDEAAFFGLLWRWEWREEPAGEAADISSRITPPVACCPHCRQVLRVAPVQSRAVYRPVWPAIFSCPCGFFKGFRQAPQALRALVYREIDRETGSAFELEPLGEEADFES